VFHLESYIKPKEIRRKPVRESGRKLYSELNRKALAGYYFFRVLLFCNGNFLKLYDAKNLLSEYWMVIGNFTWVLRKYAVLKQTALTGEYWFFIILFA